MSTYGPIRDDLSNHRHLPYESPRNTWYPWSDGHNIGFAVVNRETGERELIVFSPSETDAADESDCTFLYHFTGIDRPEGDFLSPDYRDDLTLDLPDLRDKYEGPGAFATFFSHFRKDNA